MRPGAKSCLHTCIFFLITRFSTTLVLCPPPFCAHDRASFCARAQKGATQFPRFVPGHKIRTHAANDSGHKNRVNNMAVCPCFVPGHKVVPGGTAYLHRDTGGGFVVRAGARAWARAARRARLARTLAARNLLAVDVQLVEVKNNAVANAKRHSGPPRPGDAPSPGACARNFERYFDLCA